MGAKLIMVFILFGFGKKSVKWLAKTPEMICSNCNNVTIFGLAETTTWFTLFFIKIIPYNTQRALICSICNTHIEVSKDECAKLLSDTAENKVVEEKVEEKPKKKKRVVRRKKKKTQGESE